jgi:hypothetical protein
MPSTITENSYFKIDALVQDEMGTLWMTREKIAPAIYSYNPKNESWLKFPYPEFDPKRDQNKILFEGLYEGFGDTLYFCGDAGNGYLLRNSGQYVMYPFQENFAEGHSAGRTGRIVPDRHGRLWWPGYKGITRSQRPLAKTIPLQNDVGVFITSISIDSIKYLFPPFPKVEFDDVENDLRITYAIPNPEHPQKVKYEYILEPRDRTWTAVEGKNVVEFHDLPAGKYTFKVRGDEGMGWTRETSLSVMITIPFWQTRTFPIALMSGILLMFGMGYLINDRIRVKRETTLKSEFKQQLDEIQMTALRAQMNPHFLFNSLNSIKYYAISKTKEDTADYLSKCALLVRAILNNSKSHTISLKEELEALQLYIEIEHLRLEGKFDFEIDVDKGLRIEQAQIPPMILQPYVENAIWHGLMHKSNKGRLTVQVKDLGPQIQCIIEDDGVGRLKAQEIEKEQGQHKKSVGMKITSDRIALINKMYNIDTHIHIVELMDQHGEAAGTRVIINIPIIHTS